jgi:hypothetical protein
MKYILLSLLTLLFGCASQQTRIDRASRLLRANNGQLASLCAEQFPIRERFISGKEIIKADTISVAGIHVPCPALPDQEPVFVKCPDGKKIIKTVTKTDTIERENTAKIAYLSTKLEKEQDRRNIAEADRDKYRKRASIQSLISAFVTAVLIFSVFVRWKLR